MIDWRIFPPLPALRAFAAYASTGSVQRAGNALNVSHAAISQHIRNLEAHLGVTLLDRTGRQAVLTSDGIHLAKSLNDGFETMASAIQALTDSEANRPLHISTTPSFASGWLMPRLDRFRQMAPDIDLMIDPNPELRDPSPGGIDVALRYGVGPWPGLEHELLIRTGVAVVGAPDLVAGHAHSELNTLSTLPWLQEIGTTEATTWLQQSEVTGRHQGARLVLPGALMLHALRTGQGLGVVAKVWVADDLVSGRLVLLHEARTEAGYHIVTRPGVPRAALKSFITWLRRERAGDAKLAKEGGLPAMP
ncbi:MAG: LysR family transcriptional regulator [Marinovum sp.]|nr:LysR family transcriptional regulator [Marinovum sp.]